MKLCLDCGVENFLSARHCVACGQRLIHWLSSGAPVVEGPLPVDRYAAEILPVQEWPFVAHCPDVRYAQLPTVRQVNAAATALLQKHHGKWESAWGVEKYILLEPHGAYIDAEAILDVRAVNSETGEELSNTPRVASYAIFPGLVINLRGRSKAYLVRNDPIGTVYHHDAHDATGENYEAGEEELIEMLQILEDC